MTTPIDPAVAAAQQALAATQARLDAASTQAKLLQQQKSKLKKPNAKDKKAVAAYNAATKRYDALIGQQNSIVATAQKQIPDQQNKVYELTGQYDKLLTGQNRDAFAALNSIFKSYGLGSLAGKVYDYVKQGYSGDTIQLLLQDTDEYKKRFAGNEIRKNAGLPVLPPDQYLALETSYKQIMQQAGMPPGFYDQNSDFNTWIGKNVSAAEIQSRVDLATQATILSNPAYRAALNQLGIDNGHLTAYFLDPDKALPYLQKAAATAQVGAEAIKQNLTFDTAYAEQLATQGITADQARQGYQQIAGELNTLTALAGVYGEDYNQRTSEQAVFEGNAGALQKQRRLLSQERGAFSGSAGSARGGLSQAGGAR